MIGTPSASTLTALSVTGFATGTLAYLQSRGTFWSYQPFDTSAPDGNHIPAQVGNWVYHGPGNASAALAQTVWQIDPLNGSDDNSGLAGFPVQHIGELVRRMGTTSPACSANVAVAILATIASSDPWVITPRYQGGTWTVTGTLSPVFTGTIGVFTPQVTSGSAAQNKVTATGQSAAFWTPFVGALVQDTTKAAWFRVTSDLGAATAAISAPVGASLAGGFPPWVSIASGDAITIYSMPSISLPNPTSSGLEGITFQTLKIAAGIGSLGYANFDRCSFSGYIGEAITIELVTLYNCDVDAGSDLVGKLQIFAGQVRGQVSLLGTPSGTQGVVDSVLDGDVIMTATIYVLGALQVGAAGFFDVDYADRIGQPNVVTLAQVFYGVARQWGTSAFNVAQGTQIGLAQSAASSLLLTGGYTMDGLTTAFAYNATTGAPTQVAFTPANIDANGALVNPRTGSRVFVRT